MSGDGNTALIGSPDNAPGLIGAAWVFVRSGSTWAQQGAKLSPNDEAGEGEFGTSLALSNDGNIALIGALYDNNTTEGAAWTFTRSGSTWAQEGAKLTP